jgi:hypothetical protein
MHLSIDDVLNGQLEEGLEHAQRDLVVLPNMPISTFLGFAGIYL